MYKIDVIESVSRERLCPFICIHKICRKILHFFKIFLLKKGYVKNVTRQNQNKRGFDGYVLLKKMSTPEAAASHGSEPAAAQSADKDVGTQSSRLVACFCNGCNYSLRGTLSHTPLPFCSAKRKRKRHLRLRRFHFFFFY
ncbi:MAG: hypothetical protein HDT47_07615 [Ruminococcaceae bacterium]|nr:hypothetical protein [Oscillospiraceae bacterium]